MCGGSQTARAAFNAPLLYLVCCFPQMRSQTRFLTIISCITPVMVCAAHWSILEWNCHFRVTCVLSELSADVHLGVAHLPLSHQPALK